MKTTLKISISLVYYLAAFKAIFSEKTCGAAGNNSNQRRETLENLIEWIRHQGGRFNPKSEVTLISDNDSSVPRPGMIAKQDILEDEMVLFIPAKCFFTDGLPKIGGDVLVHPGRPAVITSINSDFTFDVEFKDQEDDEDDDESEYLHLNSIFNPNGYSIICDVINNFIEEMKQGNSSQFAPYVNYVLHEISTKKSPNSWSEEGKALLQELLNDELPPYNVMNKSWDHKCQSMSNNEDNLSTMKLPYDLYHILFPSLDMISHANGNILNTKATEIDLNEGFSIKASRYIKAGEEIYHTYNLGNGLNERDVTYGTASIFREYGFVEKYPQRWFFQNYNYMTFDLEENIKSNSKTDINVRWIRAASEDDVTKLKVQLQRLIIIKETKFKEKNSMIPKKEWDVLLEYLNALMIALEHVTTTERKTYCVEGMERDSNYKEIDDIRSPYQSILFEHNPKTQDTCFLLNNRYQSCTSYRPHYHEMFVHYTARFVDKVKRVVFVGGGDSMLLHEILKYPSLELVVGLEIDQFVVRKSFQYFGTQPHWDNKKVQWYFGDAAKSLLMLPKDYYGTFDMVLVDLSETILAMSVTDQMDIMTVLSLLLKANGILVKNEAAYFEKISETFKYSVHIESNEFPVICDQNFVIGSNSCDFLKVSQKNHNVDTLSRLHQPKENSKDTLYKTWKDYRINNTNPTVNINQRELNKELNEQENSPGILMILEAEDIAVDPNDIDALIATLRKEVGKKGIRFIIHQINTDSADIEEKATVVFIMNEGYIVVRLWPKIKYCAFDIHLWSSFEKLSSIENAIVVATGSNDTSSFRIVAGGMFGISTWKDDLMNRGPGLIQHIDQNSKESYNNTDYTHTISLEDSLIDYLLQKSLSLIPDKNFKVGVICGERNKPCKSLDILRKHERVGDIVVIWSCTDFQSCENEVSSILWNATSIQFDETLLEFSNEIHTFVIGDKVKSRYKDMGFWYPAIVKAVHIDGNVDIMYENGSMEFMKERHSIFPHTGIDMMKETTKLRSIYIDSNASLQSWTIVNKLFDDLASRENMFMNNVIFINLACGYIRGGVKSLFETRNYDICEANYPLFNADIIFRDQNDNSAEILISSAGDKYFIDHVKNFTLTIEESSNTELTSEINHILSRETNCTKDELSWQLSPKDYNHSSALNQWHSQKPLGYQSIYQLEMPTFKSIRQPLKDEDILKSGDQVFVLNENYEEWYIGQIDFDYIEEGKTYYTVLTKWAEYDDVQRHEMMKNVKVPLEESEIIPLSANIIKDGTSAICNSVNHCKSHEFTNIGNGSTNVIQFESGVIIVLWDGNRHVDVNIFTFFEQPCAHEDLVDLFLQKVPSMEISLQDTYPRGTGHVVNFAADLKSQDKPIWA